jgi:hypothetical protein
VGNGVIIDEEGHGLTNDHGVRRGEAVAVEALVQQRSGPFLFWERNTYELPVR